MFRYTSSKALQTISAVIDVMHDTDYIWYQDDTLNGMPDDIYDIFVMRVASIFDYHSLDISNKGLISYIIGAELHQYKQDHLKLRLKITGTDNLTGEVLDEQICTIKASHCHRLNKVINSMAKDGMNIHVDVDE